MWKKFMLGLCVWGLCAHAWAMDRPVLLEDQGSFFAGGTVVTAPGEYKDDEPLNFAGETLYGDAAYVFWQRPVKAYRNKLVFLHGYGQSGKTWETTPDGRDGFQNIFLAKGWSTYIVDQPRRGRAGKSTVPAALTAQPQDQMWYDNFRLGQYPDYYDGVAVPRDEASLIQFLQQMVPDTGKYDVQVVADALGAVFDKIGDGVLVTHSAGGAPGWLTAIRNKHVKAVIALEPGTFPFPEAEVPAVEQTTSPFPAKPMPVSDSDFQKLLKIPVIVYYGDFIPSGTEPVKEWGLDNWRIRKNMADKWAQVVKAHGGDVTVVSLPEVGIKGNTHFIMSDTNNQEVAEHIAKWLKQKGLSSKQ